jgi:hypothetical protein
MFYLDSSVLVSLFSNEAYTPVVRAWHAGLDPEEVFLSVWNIPEFYSAMSFKRRTDQMSAEQRAAAEQLFEAYRKNYPNTLDVSIENFHRAALIAGREDINIRAADALHLAIAETNEATICTLDRKMHEAAKALGLDCLIP